VGVSQWILNHAWKGTIAGWERPSERLEGKEQEEEGDEKRRPSHFGPLNLDDVSRTHVRKRKRAVF